MRQSSGETKSAAHVVVVGAGGNIGSHLIPHLGRMPGVGRVTLIDPDVYEPQNLRGQDIGPHDIGKRKALVQARRLRRINRMLAVKAIADAVEVVPLGSLRSDVILGCLDSRIARQCVNQFAWRLGVPLIDAGVEPGGLLARINVYEPAGDRACLECAWDDRDYEALEQTYACAGFESKVAPTNAPSSLGALAASLQAIECQKLLEDRTRRTETLQVLIDAMHHRHYLTAFRRNPNCRFDHQVWQIQKLKLLPGEGTLNSLLVRLNRSWKGASTLSVEGKRFVKRVVCSSCGWVASVFRIEHALATLNRRCVKCGGRMAPAGFEMVERVDIGSVFPRLANRSLQRLGLRYGDVFVVSDGVRRAHYELSK